MGALSLAMESAWQLGLKDGCKVLVFREALTVQRNGEDERTHFKENNLEPRKVKPLNHYVMSVFIYSAI